MKLNWAIGKDVDKAQNPSRQKDSKILWISAAKLQTHVEPEMKVTHDSKENHIGNRMQKAVEHFKSGKFMDPADVSFRHHDPEHRLQIGNGRHRIAAAQSLGVDRIPVSVSHDEVEHISHLAEEVDNTEYNLITELSKKVMQDYLSKATPDIMRQILQKSNKKKAAQRARNVSKVMSKVKDNDDSK